MKSLVIQLVFVILLSYLTKIIFPLHSFIQSFIFVLLAVASRNDSRHYLISPDYTHTYITLSNRQNLLLCIQWKQPFKHVFQYDISFIRGSERFFVIKMFIVCMAPSVPSKGHSLEKNHPPIFMFHQMKKKWALKGSDQWETRVARKLANDRYWSRTVVIDVRFSFYVAAILD